MRWMWLLVTVCFVTTVGCADRAGPMPASVSGPSVSSRANAASRSESAPRPRAAQSQQRAPVAAASLVTPPPHPFLSSTEQGTATYPHLPEQRPQTAAVSTFGVDVDTASFTNVRRMVTDGTMPPENAVRVEEFINYFKYRYPEPANGAAVGVTTELAACPWAQGHLLLRIGVKARDVQELPPCNLVFLIDTSGSMGTPERLPLIVAGLRELVAVLRPVDRVSIVTYAGQAGCILKGVSGSNKAAILDALNDLSADGATAGGDGIRMAYRVAHKTARVGDVTRVILATDGDFNVGVTSPDALQAMVEKERASGVYLSCIGVGDDNFKDAVMQRLADNGNGNYAYVANARDAKRALVDQRAVTLVTVAEDVKIQVAFDCHRVAAWRLLGYEKRALKTEDFKNDAKDSGDMGAGHTTTAFYEIRPQGLGGETPQGFQTTADGPPQSGLATVDLRYKRPHEIQAQQVHVTVADPVAEPTADFAFAAAVAEYALLLRDSQWRGHASLDRVAERARASGGDDPDRLEFVRLVDTTIQVASRAREGAL